MVLSNDNVIEIQVMGGLGNQLHCLAAGIVIANHLRLKFLINTERVKFGSNMSRKSELETIYFPNSDDYLKTKILTNMNFKYSYEVIRRKSRGILPISNFMAEPDYFDSGSNVNEQILAIPKTTRSVGGPFIDFEWADRAVDFGFPSELVPRSPSNDYESHLSKIDDLSIALHVRLGDYLDLREIFPIVTDAYYLESLDLLKVGQERRLHVFTDSPELVHDFLPKLFKTRNVEIIDPELRMKPVEVMSSMSKYPYLITSNSTFSSWAGWFSPRKKVVTPTPHLKHNWIDRLPRHWLRLPL